MAADKVGGGGGGGGGVGEQWSLIGFTCKHREVNTQECLFCVCIARMNNKVSYELAR